MQRILVVAVAVLALAACSKQPAEITANDQVPADQRTASATEGAGAGASEGGGAAATWVAVDIAFDAAPETVAAGETITLVNEGAATHNVTIEDEVIVEANGGETAEGTLALEPGTYEYICSVPGHEASMNGEITVE